MATQLDDTWKEVLHDEFEKDYMKALRAFLLAEKASGYTIYPPNPLIFNAFNHTPFPKTNVVIIGQDPYHGKNQAHGLAFSVQKGVRIPPSLHNIYLELQNNIVGFKYPPHGELTRWADQGVLLLNATLTVRAGQPASHQKKGWERFTDEAIKRLAERRSGIVFLLWGKYAQSKQALIDETKHYILQAAHPSPYSAHHGFFGCMHFSKTNDYLISKGLKRIDWQII